MEELVNHVLSGTDAAATAATASLLGALRSRAMAVLDLVALLKRPLTDDVDHEGRAKAVQLLAQVSAEAPESLLSGDVGVMADFLAAKLKDWRCVAAAAPGCLAVLQRYRQPALAQLPEAAAVAVCRIFTGVHVQALDYKGRIACYQLLLEILQGPYGAAAALAGVDLVSFTVVAMENEADPRCLMHCLKCVQAVGKLYNQPGLKPLNHLHHGLEDLFDVGVVPYFPMMFKPQKSDPGAITRDQLLQEVIAAMGCCPQFAALGIPLLSEKLGSALSQAKADSLLALPACCKAWGAPAVKQHLQAVWLMLKPELLAPAAAEGLLADQLASKHATAAAAAAALQDTISALGPGLLDTHVLNDVCMEDLQQYLGLANPPWASNGDDGAAAAAAWDLPERAQRRLACIAKIVAAVAAAGAVSCAAVCKDLLRPAVTAVLDDTANAPDTPTTVAADSSSSSSMVKLCCLRPLQANCAVICVLHNVLSAVAANIATAAAAAGDGDGVAATAAGAGSSCYAALAELTPDMALMAGRLQQRVYQQQQQQQDPAAAAVNLMQANQLQLWLLLLWQDLMALPNNITRLEQQTVDTVAKELVQLALHSGTIDIELQLAPGGTGSTGSTTTSAAAAAAAAVTKMAGWPPAAAAAAAAGDDYVIVGDSTSTAAAAAESKPSPSGMQAVQQHAAPLLLQLLQNPTTTTNSSSSSTDEEGFSRALSLVQQIAGSSAVASWQVLLWLQPLIIRQVQQRDLGSLNTFLPILYSHCVPALPDSLAPAESAAASDLCTAVLQAWQQQQQQYVSQPSSSSSSDETLAINALLHSCILLGSVVAKCRVEDQKSITLTACEWVSTAAAVASMGVQDDVQGLGPTCLAAAVLAAARPGLLTASSVVDLVTALATVATAAATAPSSGSSSGGGGGSGVTTLDSSTAGIALASVIHKCFGCTNTHYGSTGSTVKGAVTPDVLLAAALPQLLSGIQQWAAQAVQQSPQHQHDAAGTSSTGSAPAVQTVLGAVHAVAWVARGLAMQRHDSWQQCMHAVLQLLLAAAAAASGSTSAVQVQVQQQVLWAAADFFSILITLPTRHQHPASPTVVIASSSSSSSSSSVVALGLQLSLHNLPRPLWQQKAFTIAQQALSAAISTQQQAVQEMDAAAAAATQEQQGLWLAAACLLSAAPSAVTASAREQVVPLLLQSLARLTDMWPALPSSSSSSDVAAALVASTEVLDRLLQLLHKCLTMVAEFLLAADSLKPLLEPYVGQLLGVLCKLARLTMQDNTAAAAAAAAAGDGCKGTNASAEGGRVVGGVAATASNSSSSSAAVQRRRLAGRAAAVREVALMCLTSLMALPYHLLHPYRRQVVAVLNAALDDDRRAVRKAAVVAKASWTGAVPT